MYKKYIILLFMFIWLLLSLIDTPESNGGVAGDVNLKKLVQSSEMIVIGKCLTSYSDWNSIRSEICTYTVIEVIQTLKGDPEIPVIIETLGGKVGNLVSTVTGAPVFRENEKSIFFLYRKRSGQPGITGLNRGKFDIRLKDGNEIVINPFVQNIIIPADSKNPQVEIDAQNNLLFNSLLNTIKGIKDN